MKEGGDPKVDPVPVALAAPAFMLQLNARFDPARSSDPENKKTFKNDPFPTWSCNRQCDELVGMLWSGDNSRRHLRFCAS